MPFSGELILVVDDGPEVVEAFTAVLAGAGYRVASAVDGEAGLRLARELRPRLVLLNMMMPEVDGLELLRRLPHECAPPLPAVIAASGFPALEADALARGARAFLHKPVHPDDLLGAIEAVLSGTVRQLSPARQIDRVAQAARRADEARDALLGGFALTDAELRRRLESLVRWLTGYFGVAMAAVNLARGGKIHFEVATGFDGALDRDHTGVDPRLTFCAEVVRAGSCLILGDGKAHPAFASHPAVRIGLRFYAGTPLRTASGLVLGTLCVVDREPRIFHAEDVSVLEDLATGIAWAIERQAQRRPGRLPLFEPPGVFGRTGLQVLAAAELRRASRGGAVELALVSSEHEEPDLLTEIATAAYREVAPARFAVARYGPGVLAFIAGGPTLEGEHERIDRALAITRRHLPGFTGAGAVAVSSGAAWLLGVSELLRMADDARAHATMLGSRSLQRVVVSQPLTAEAMSSEPAP